jgi:lysophospholipase L1-like esterase
MGAAASLLSRKLLFAALMVLLFFGAVDVLLRFVGIDRPASPRLVVRTIDIDITFPFMRPDRDLFWSPIPGFRGEFMGKTVTINSVGLRGVEVAIPKAATKRRMLCFGDSITFGYGVGDDETYAFHLGRALTPRGIEIVNCGVTGYSSYQALHLLRRVATRLEGDMALFLIGWNDSARRPVDDWVYARRVRVAMDLEKLSDYWYLYRLFKTFYLRSFENERETSALKTRATPSQYEGNMEAIVAECRALGIVPLFIDLPRRRCEGETEFESAYSDVLNRVGDKLSVPVINPGHLGLETPLSSNIYYFIDTLHFNPEGHKYMAELLTRELAELGVM